MSHGHGLLPLRPVMIYESCLIGDVVPSSRSSKLLKFGPEQGPHVDDPVCHGLHVRLPLLEQLGVVQNAVHDPDAVSGRIWVPENEIEKIEIFEKRYKIVMITNILKYSIFLPMLLGKSRVYLRLLAKND